MTYLEMVNKVLVRLREPTTTTITSGNLAPLIAALVNDAYHIVEDAHDWSVLRSKETVATVADQETVTLTGVPVDSMVYDAYIAGGRMLHRRSKDWFMRQDIWSTPNTTGSPTDYVISGASDTTGDLTVDLHPTPDGVYTITFLTAKRGTAPTLASDRIILPTDPILHLSLALATRERGETGGTSAAEYFRLSDLSLGQAIARDANHRPDELVLYTP